MPEHTRLTEFHKYPVITGIVLLAAGVTVASWMKFDIAPLMENEMIRRGELWRLVTSIFPHVGILHLIFNVYWIWIFGTILERTFGHARTAALVLLFAIIPNALEYAFSIGGVGLSGVAYGMFGLLWMLSRHDDRFRQTIDSSTINLFVVWFFVCIVATATHIMNVGNVAHGAGAIVGILTGLAIALPERAPITAGLGIILAFSLWSATSGRPKVNLSTLASYDECRRGFEAMEANQSQEALHWFEAAASYRNNLAGCQRGLAWVYRTVGRQAESVAEYRKAAEMGDASSQCILGDMYAKGEGMAKDSRQAVLWYKKAAESDSPDVLNNVAWALATSSDPAIQNPTESLRLALQAVNAEKGSPRAFILDTLAQAYYVNQQYEKALSTEEKALASATPAEQTEYRNKIETYKAAVAGQQRAKID